jgi:hypothetical protein
MDKPATYMARQNLHDIIRYAKLSLDLLHEGAGEIHPMMLFKAARARSNMQDVGHFLRYQNYQGRKYGTNITNSYLFKKCMREIMHYANDILSNLENGAGEFPQWVNHKISVTAEYLDCVGHYLENEAAEGRRYGAAELTTGAREIGAPRNNRSVGYIRDIELSVIDPYMNGPLMKTDSYPPSDVGGVRMVEPQFRRIPQPMGVKEHPLRRNYGVPGFSYGQPGWAGQGGVDTSFGRRRFTTRR